MKQFKQFINGEFVNSTSTNRIEILNPCTEEVLSTIPKGSAEDANLALESAKEAQPKWQALPAFRFHVGHGDVHHHDVRAEVARHLHGGAPVLGLADHLDPALLRQDRAQAVAHHRVIVDEQDSNRIQSVRHAFSPSLGSSSMGTESST